MLTRTKPTPMSSMYFYAMDGKHATYCGVRIILDEEIDFDLMKGVILRLSKRFPYLCRKLVVQDGCIYTEANDFPILLHKDPLDKILNIRNNYGHLMRLSVWNNVFTIQIFHGLSDGSGVLNYLKMALVEYYKAKGEKVVPPADLFDMEEINVEELLDPFSVCSTDGPRIPLTNKKFFRINQKREKNRDNLYLFSCDSAKFVEYAKRSGGSPNSLMSLIMAKAMRQVYPESLNQDIDIGIAISAKSVLGIKKSHVPCLMCSIFSFNNEVLSQTPEQIHAAIRQKIRKQTSTESVLAELNSIRSLEFYYDNMKGLRSKRLLCQSITEIPATSASISYVGRIDFGSVEKHIRGIYSTAEAVSPVMEINCTSDRFFFSLNAKFDALPYVQAIHSMFVENDMDCSEIEIQSMNYDRGATDRPHFGFNYPSFQLIKATIKYKSK